MSGTQIPRPDRERPTGVARRPDDWLAAFHTGFHTVAEPTPAFAALRDAVARLHPTRTQQRAERR